MQLFKFTPVTSPTKLEQGQTIPRPSSVTWTERYRDAGTFEITAPVSYGLKDFLPEGTFISHVDTMEVMVVENHEITETELEDPVLKVTGRTADAVMDNRIVGTDLARAAAYAKTYNLGAYASWQQAVNMINSHIVDTVDANDKIDFFAATHTCTGTATADEREIAIGSLYSGVQEILTVDDLGIKTIRRNPFTGYGGGPTNTIFVVHQGVDRSTEIIFSWKGGDLEQAEYLFSGKTRKNSALVKGRFIWKIVDLGPTKYDRRMMVVDANDIDDNLDHIPIGTELANIQARLVVRGKQALAAQKRIQITRTDISNFSKYRYRRDYNVGDLVTIDGNFGRIQKMRVNEFTEIEDETGFSGHPTLTLLGE